jgi:LysR family nitrogen assimilation transcriptional regulator
MDLRQLRYFIGVSESGSLLKASRLLHIAQPALGQHIVALESELGTQLFVRTSKGMTPTPAGRTFVEHARIVLADVERARLSLKSCASEMDGEVAIGLPTTVALVATLPILSAIKQRFPAVRPRIVESHSGYLREWLQLGRLDLSVLFEIKQEPWLMQRALLREKLCLVGARNGRRRTLGTSVPLRRLAEYPLYLPGKDHGLRRILDQYCGQRGVKLQVIGEIDSLPNIKKAVENGMAYTVLSPAAVAEEVSARKLEAATLNSPEISRTIVYATSLTRPLTPVASAVGELLCEELSKLVVEGRWPGVLEKG